MSDIGCDGLVYIYISHDEEMIIFIYIYLGVRSRIPDSDDSNDESRDVRQRVPSGGDVRAKQQVQQQPPESARSTHRVSDDNYGQLTTVSASLQ